MDFIFQRSTGLIDTVLEREREESKEARAQPALLKDTVALFRNKSIRPAVRIMLAITIAVGN